MGRTSVRAFAIWAVVVAMAACGGTGSGQAGPAGTVQGQQVTRRGVVSSGNAASFMIGSQAVVTSPATQFIDGTAANVVSGAQVEVEGTLDAQGTLQADKVRFEQQQQPEPQEIKVEGVVTSGNSASFMIGNQTVVTSAATQFIDGTAANVMPGVRVEVEGTIDAQATLHAEKVKFEEEQPEVEAEVRLQAVPENLMATDATNGTFTLLGITIRTGSFTEFKDFKGNPIDLQHLGSGPVAVRGTVASNGTEVRASRLELSDDERLELQGPVKAKDLGAHRLTILGAMVDTAAAEFEGAGTEADFFAAVSIGTVVKARGENAGAFSGGVLMAEEVELEGK